MPRAPAPTLRGDGRAGDPARDADAKLVARAPERECVGDRDGLLAAASCSNAAMGGPQDSADAAVYECAAKVRPVSLRGADSSAWDREEACRPCGPPPAKYCASDPGRTRKEPPGRAAVAVGVRVATPKEPPRGRLEGDPAAGAPAASDAGPGGATRSLSSGGAACASAPAAGSDTKGRPSADALSSDVSPSGPARETCVGDSCAFSSERGARVGAAASSGLDGAVTSALLALGL